MKKIYSYLDYRQFLNDYFSLKKEENSHYSLRMMGRLIEMDASYLAKLLSGKRHLSPRSMPKLCQYLKFDFGEAEYFETLVYFNKARSEEQKRTHFETLLTLRKPHTTSLEGYQYAFYKKWFYTALRNLLEFYPFYQGDDYSDLGAQLSPKITGSEAQEGIELLAQLNLVTLSEDNRYELTDSAITSGTSWSSLAIKDYQIETIELSRQSLDRHPKAVRDISTVTMNVSEDEFEKITEMLQKFRSSVINYVNESEHPDRVYQLNMQMIPLCQNGAEHQNGAQ